MKIYRLSAGEFRSWRDPIERKQLQRRIFDESGITQIRAPSGRILGTARGGGERVPIERARVRGAHHAIAPAECLCREWQKPEGREDEHHPICAHKSHWEAQLAHSPDVPRERAVLNAADRPASNREPPTAAPAEPERAPVPPAPAPEACICRDWAGTSPAQHHALCEFRDRWQRENQLRAPDLVELETGEVAREATPEEAEASRAKAAEDGVGAIELSDGKLYYVRQP